MSARAGRRTSHKSGWSWLAALVAIVSQLALGAVVLPDAQTDQRAVLASVSIFCDGTTSPQTGGAAPHRHHAADPALCPLAVTLSLPSVMIAPAPQLPLPSNVVFAAASRERPPGRGPPLPTARDGLPRAPPFFA